MTPDSGATMAESHPAPFLGSPGAAGRGRITAEAKAAAAAAARSDRPACCAGTLAREVPAVPRAAAATVSGRRAGSAEWGRANQRLPLGNTCNALVLLPKSRLVARV